MRCKRPATVPELASGPGYPAGAMSHEELARLRERTAVRNPRDRWLQELLAPFEHQAFAREWVREDPLVAVPSLGVAIPAYQLAKLFGLGGKEATPASLDQMFGGYRGLVQGLRR